MVFNKTTQNRGIGTIGTVARIILGIILFGSVFYGHIIKGPFRPLPWVMGLFIFPGVFIIWQTLRARHHSAPLRANSPFGTVANVVIFFAFYFTFLYAPSIDFMSDAVLIFYGLSMLVAALRGYGGCESLAISNWLLRRDDQIGCLLFLPIDAAESKLAGRPRTTKDAS
jgi:dolichyl-phosphate-mannose--protein O-mannosyl transferase